MERKDAIELYKVFKQQSATALSTYHSHIQHYRVLIAAITGASFATIVAVLNLPCRHQELTRWLMLVTLILPAANVLLCLLAIRQSDHPYRAFLETVTVQAKLEPLIGLVERPLDGTERGARIPFPDDHTLVPERWLEPGKYPTAEQFVDEYIGKGSNRLARCLFITLAAANLAVMVAASVYLFCV